MSAGLAVLCIVSWLALGSNRGWTKTTRTRMDKDPVTDIVFPTIEKHFSPGLELLAVGLLASAAFAGASLACKPKQPPEPHE